MIRHPAVAGRFYPSSAVVLKKEIGSLLGRQSHQQREVTACILPHAGYVYSGAVACSVVSQLDIKKNIIILGPNHTGFGEVFSVMTEGAWETPFGDINVNTALAGALLKNSPLLKADARAHQFEHSIEVELPILQYFREDFSLVPIIIAVDDFKNYQMLGEQIADTIKKVGLEKEVLIIASSDMTHYEDAASARQKDNQAIEAILELNEEKLWSRVNEYNMTMCGYAPTVTMLVAAKKLGAKKGELIKYQTSGDVTGDNSSVVGYAGIIIN